MMDAVEFLEQLKKRSKSNPDYYGEELNIAHIEPISLVSQVEQWAAEHPAKTRQSVFLEQYPEAKLTEDGVLALCPMAISSEYRGENDSCVSCSRKCDDCRRKFWLAEVE
jgi:hypothetical protein